MAGFLSKRNNLKIKRAGPMKMHVVSCTFRSCLHGNVKTFASMNSSNPINKRINIKNIKKECSFRNAYIFFKTENIHSVSGISVSLTVEMCLDLYMVHRSPSMNYYYF